MHTYRISFHTLFGDGLDVTRVFRAESLYQAYSWAMIEVHNNPFYAGPFHISRVDKDTTHEI